MDVKYHNGFPKKVRQVAVVPAVEGVKYKECGRNHALASSGCVVDSFREWMPLGDLNPVDASSYKWAACGCHDSLHRKKMMERSPSRGSAGDLSIITFAVEAAMSSAGHALV